MIRLEQITKSFGSLQVLRGIDLEIQKGEVVSIVGPSGAGKTTLLQIMGTLDRPDTGSVRKYVLYLRVRYHYLYLLYL